MTIGKRLMQLHTNKIDNEKQLFRKDFVTAVGQA